MYIPLITLAEKANFSTDVFSDIDSTLLIKGIRLLPAQVLSLCANFLYIQDMNNGQIKLTSTDHTGNLVWQKSVVDSRPIEVVFNQLLEIIEQFSRWDKRVHELFIKNQNLQRIIRVLSKMMGNPIYLVDASYKVLAIDDRATYSDISPIWRHLSQHRYLSYDIITQLHQQKELDKLDNQRTASLFHSKVFPNIFINRTLIIDHKVAGHLFVVGYCKQITPGDLALAEQIGCFLEKISRYDLALFSSRGRNYENFFIHVIEEKNQDPSLVAKQLSILQWTIDGNYFIAVLRRDSMTPQLLEGICRTIEKNYGGKPVIYKNQVVIIFSPAQYADYTDICQRLFHFSQKEHCAVGVSDLFFDFLRLSVYYEQAVFAAAYATIQNQTENSPRICFYSEVAVFHILQGASASVNLALSCEPSIEKLADYDRIHRTDYLHTLEVFLNNERNITDTAADLFIHRSTMLYRIERLEKMLSVDLNNPVVRMRLLLSIYLYRADLL